MKYEIGTKLYILYNNDKIKELKFTDEFKFIKQNHRLFSNKIIIFKLLF
jgi:hypothetical protein